MAPPSAILTIHAKGARGLKDVERWGTMDPYLKLCVGGQVFRTKVATDSGTSAHWDECFRVQLTGDVQREHLYLEVEDKDLVGAKQVGTGKIPLAQIPPARFDGSFAVFDARGRQTGTLDLGLCLERFDAPLPPANTQPLLAPTPILLAPVPLPAVYAPPQEQPLSSSSSSSMMMLPPATPPHRPPKPHPHANSGYPAASANASPRLLPTSPPYHHHQPATVVMPGPLAYASTPARPYTPVPPPELVVFSPYPPPQQRYHISPTSSAFSAVAQPATPPSMAGTQDDACPLPPHWEARRTGDGQVFYVDHIHKTTSWERPVAACYSGGGAPAYSTA